MPTYIRQSDNQLGGNQERKTEHSQVCNPECEGETCQRDPVQTRQIVSEAVQIAVRGKHKHSDRNSERRSANQYFSASSINQQHGTVTPENLNNSDDD